MAERSAVFPCGSCGTKPHSQDKIYGQGKRLYNKMANGQFRCTVCLKVRGEVKIEKDKK